MAKIACEENYYIKDNIVYVKSKRDNVIKRLLFSYLVRQVMSYQDKMLIRIEPDIGKILNENIFCYSRDGDFLWQIEPLVDVKKDSPYTNIYQHDGNLLAYNWRGDECLIDAGNGKIIAKRFLK